MALGLDNWVNISLAVIVGLLVGIIIGQSTEYYTSQSYKPTRKLSESGKTGPATVIISGIGLGMISTTIPVIAVVAGIILSYWLASGFDFTNIGMGLYGIGIASVGMLSTLGITLATDAYGPIADNAGGNAEMSKLGEEVRRRTDALDSLGNTTAATGKDLPSARQPLQDSPCWLHTSKKYVSDWNVSEPPSLNFPTASR